jgi:hypothetical protein
MRLLYRNYSASLTAHCSTSEPLGASRLDLHYTYVAVSRELRLSMAYCLKESFDFDYFRRCPSHIASGRPI